MDGSTPTYRCCARFTAGLRRDRGDVVAGMTLHDNSGAVEGP